MIKLLCRNKSSKVKVWEKTDVYFCFLGDSAHEQARRETKPVRFWSEVDRSTSIPHVQWELLELSMRTIYSHRMSSFKKDSWKTNHVKFWRSLSTAGDMQQDVTMFSSHVFFIRLAPLFCRSSSRMVIVTLKECAVFWLWSLQILSVWSWGHVLMSPLLRWMQVCQLCCISSTETGFN